MEQTVTLEINTIYSEDYHSARHFRRNEQQHTRRGLRGRIHVYELAYDLVYDFVHDLHSNQKGI
jgi:hypothetical protein